MGVSAVFGIVCNIGTSTSPSWLWVRRVYVALAVTTFASPRVQYSDTKRFAGELYGSSGGMGQNLNGERITEAAIVPSELRTCHCVRRGGYMCVVFLVLVVIEIVMCYSFHGNQRIFVDLENTCTCTTRGRSPKLDECREGDSISCLFYHRDKKKQDCISCGLKNQQRCSSLGEYHRKGE